MLKTLFSLYPEIFILIVDDQSPDKTSDQIRFLQKTYPNLHLLERPAKLGLGTAYKDGMAWALKRDYQFIFQMDCDFSHSPDDIKNLHSLLTTQHLDLVIGSRYVDGHNNTRNWPWYRLLLSLGSSTFLRAFTGLRIKDLTGGFKGWRRSALEKIDLNKIISKGYVFQFEMNYRAYDLNFKIAELPIIFHQRTAGKSKLNTLIMLEAIYIFFYLRTKKIFGMLN
jgi:dolichol-phosphate mannosyltransferase